MRDSLSYLDNLLVWGHSKLSLIIYVWERLSQLVNQCNNSSGKKTKLYFRRKKTRGVQYK